MVQKKYHSLHEHSFFLDFQNSPERKISKLLREEATAFRERNSIIILGCDLETKKPIHKCCQSCLKAHLIKKAESLGLYRDLREILFSMVEHETGHYGYYTDGDELIKV